MKAPATAPKGFDWAAQLQSWRATAGGSELVVRTVCESELRILLRAVTPSLVRMTILPPEVPDPTPSPLIVMDVSHGVSLSVQETLDAVSFRTSAAEIRVHRGSWGMQFRNAKGELVLAENPLDVDGLGRWAGLPLGFVLDDKRVVRTTHAFGLRADEHLYGLGEKFTALDKTGQRMVSWNVDALGSTSERSHKNIPLLLSTYGYGLFLDTTACVKWDLGAVSCQSYTIQVDAPLIDAYILLGDSPSDILAQYADLTGHAPVPPKWSFGLWVSSGGTYRDRASMEQLVDGLARHDLPADVIHVDPWWMRWRKYCDFQWNELAFPKPAEFIQRLHADGLKLCLWEHPYVSVESDLFTEGKEKGYFVRRPDGEVYIIAYGLSLAPLPDGVVREASAKESWNAPVAVIDLTHPGAYEWFKDLHRPVLRMGADVFKTDFGEDIPADAVFHNGATGATMHNLYPLLYNRAVTEVTLEERGEGLVWSRSGTAGNQRYPVCWSGDPAADFQSLACTIRGGLSAGLSGIPFWSNDIGGYRGRPSPRLFVRWAQFGLLCSHSRMHGDSPREPWRFGNEALAIVREYVKLRYRLFPYLYSCAHEASRTGMPVIRAMPLAFPRDPTCSIADLQYLLGPFLLVAPVTDESEHRRVYIPEGGWVDYWTDEPVFGPRWVDVRAPLERLPLFVRAGALIPTMRDARRIPDGWLDPIVLDVYPGADVEYAIEEDLVVSRWSMKHEMSRLTMEYSGTRERQWILRLHSDKRIARVSCSVKRESGFQRIHLLPPADRRAEIPLPSASAASVDIEFLPEP